MIMFLAAVVTTKNSEEIYWVVLNLETQEVLHLSEPRVFHLHQAENRG